MIAANESIPFDIRQSFLCGDEAANVGVIRIGFAGGAASRWTASTATGAGRREMAGIRAFWEAEPIRTSSRPRSSRT